MSGQTIVIIDDDKHLVELLQSYLEAQGFLVYTAHDGRSVMTMARGRKPALMILDVDMPFVDGLSALAALRKDGETSRIPVIMLTGMASGSVYPRIENAPRVSHLKKPVSLEDLGSLIKHYLPDGQSRE